ncbi:sugar phosphate isomerase/epimerase family protein [Adhaeribacter radiodurans]|uniref:Sugar phosphate isomerase/epimerase n=1 Tax=Adhaeribacter radiodurans TaxID=2745197 RepID=A0A7L7L551_9BACT|nr:sugar phosphate isomerase/epimerase family protein [Adhaeribacter radiodurans]QMU27903.1 sugar phosphate isomerase/epimerase [Adhaeribacter radiodurans]
MTLYSRRDVLRTSAYLSGLGLLHALDLFAISKTKQFKIGACDWSINQMGKPEAFAVAKQIGLDGVQVSLGTAANNMQLRQPEKQQQYRQAARQAGLAIGGLAIGELNNVPYKSAPETEQWVSDAMTVARNLGVKVILLAFFEKGDLLKDSSGQQEVIRRLRKVVPQAEKAGVILGIESWLSARESKDLVDAVNSKNVRVYYDVANSTQMGYNIYDEIRWLGKEYICEIHAKENGSLLGQGKIDFKAVRRALDAIGYTGWIQIEGAVPPKQAMLESYQANNKFIRSIFS